MIDPALLLRCMPQLEDNPNALNAMAKACTKRTAPPGHTLIKEGDDATFLLGTLDGEVDIQRYFGTEQRTVARLGPGILLGEAALVPGLKRTASVRSHTRLEYFKLPAETFRNAILQSPAFIMDLIERQMKRLQQRENAYLEALRQGIIVRDKELAELRLGRAEQNQPEGVWSPSMQPVLDRANRLAQSDLPILIAGESGTGKELMASYIHRRSDRAAQDIRSLNCAAIPAEIAEAELFGVKKGAYTGATQDRDGLLRATDGGTLFLDEIGDLPLAQQAKLLRALQDGTFYPVGSQTLEHADVRLVSATNKNLREEVAAGRFREDLLYRIAGAQVTLPPLRERRDHIPILVHWLVGHAIKDVEPVFVTQDIMSTLLKYRWPGNVRELMSVMKAAMALAEEFPRLRVTDLPEDLVAEVHGDASQKAAGATFDAATPLTSSDLRAVLADRSLTEYLRDTTAALISRALDAHHWVRKDAAAALGITPQNLSNYIRRLKIATQPPGKE